MVMPSISRTVIEPGRYYEAPFKRSYPNPHFPNSGTSTYYKWPFQVSYEEMTPNSEGSHREWKSFEHYRVQNSTPTMSHKVFQRQSAFGYDVVNVVDSEDPFIGIPSTSNYGSLGEFNGGLPRFYEHGVDGSFVPPPPNLNELQIRAFSSIMPFVKANLSAVNSTIELKDFISLPHSVRDVIRFFARTGKTLRNFFRVAADAYLQDKFNIAPLLSDISGVHSALRTIERRMNDLVAREGRVQTRHFVYRWAESPPFVTDTQTLLAYDPVLWYGSPFDGPSIGYREVVTPSSEFHVEIQYNYNYTAYQRQHAVVLGFLDAIGVNLNPRIIWNAIPWSFVVDWVLGVGQWLDQFKVLNMEPQINIIRYLWSIKRRRKIVVSTKVGTTDPVFGFAGSPRSQVSLVDESSYRRFAGMPALSLITSSGLSPTEVSLGAALVLSRRRRPTSRRF